MVLKNFGDGFEEFIFYYPGKENLQKVMEQVAKEVLPTFRK